MRRWLGLVLYLTALTIWVTWPQAARMRSVYDFGDPLLNSWILAWVAHAVHAAPAHLFNANIFSPETNTLAYSESLLLPGLALAPLFWAGVDPIVVYNLLLLGGYVLSGLTMFALARYVTGKPLPALVAATVFAVYPYRAEAYGHVQLELAFWLPLALLAVHRLVREGRLRFGAHAGIFLALQAYTCVYYAIYGSLIVFVVGLVLIARAQSRRVAIAGLAIAACVAAAGAAPLARPYLRASAVVGERSAQEVTGWSARLADYRRAHPENWLYGSDAHPGDPERRLFPGYTNVGLAVVGVAFGVDRAASAAYLAAAVSSVDLSLGSNGVGYTWLYEHVRAFRALRVPARLGMMAGLALALLSALGAARLVANRTPIVAGALTCVLLASIAIESRDRPLDLSTLTDRHPAVYAWLATQPPGVVCEYPVGNLEGRVGPQDSTYEYYSTMHWKPLVNGYSGFESPSYVELKSRLGDFPSQASVDYLRARGVTYLFVHQEFYIKGDYAADVAALRQRRGLEWLGAFGWRDGAQSAVFRLR